MAGSGRPGVLRPASGWLRPAIGHAVAGRAVLWLAVDWLWPAMRVCRRIRLNLGPILFVLTLCGPSVAVQTSRLVMPSVVGYFGWLDRRATLVYEL